MDRKPTYEKLEQSVKELEKEVVKIKQAEKKLKKLSAVVDALVEGVIITDLHENITYVNKAVTEQLGYKKDNLIGKTPAELIVEKELPKFAGQVQGVLSGMPLPKSNEYLAKHKNGKEIPMSINFSLLNDLDGKPNGIIAACRDISERKQSDNALRQNAEKYRDLFENVSDFLYFHNLEGTFIETNLAWKSELGFSENDLINLNVKDLIPDQYIPQFEDYLKKIIENGKNEGLMIVMTKDGRERIMEYRNSLVYDSTGPIGIRGSARDITESIEAKKKLKKSEERYRNILENIEDGYYEVDIAGNFTFINDSMSKILKYSKDELIGMNNRHYMDQENAKKVYQKFNTVYQTGTPDKGYDWEYIKKGGTKIDIETSISLMKDLEGQSIGFRGVLRDVSERKRAEKQLKNYSQNLEKMVEERTAELKKTLTDLQNTQSQLIQSEKMASIGQLAAGVAHEINNPVGYVKSNLGTMDEYRKDLIKLLDHYQTLEATLHKEKEIGGSGAIREVLGNIRNIKDEIDLAFILNDHQKVIEESVEGMARVAKIVSDLKDFAHVDKADMEHADINRGIESTINIVWNEIKYKAEVIKDLGDIPLVKCYPQRLNQVFMNLLMNAAHAIEGKGTIRVSTRAENGKVEIEISDTGKGIPPDILPKIFDPFFTTKEVGKGTGLGLNVSYNIIKKHNGIIDVESEMGKGTSFIIRIPVEI